MLYMAKLWEISETELVKVGKQQKRLTEMDI